MNAFSGWLLHIEILWNAKEFFGPYCLFGFVLYKQIILNYIFPNGILAILLYFFILSGIILQIFAFFPVSQASPTVPEIILLDVSDGCRLDERIIHVIIMPGCIVCAVCLAEWRFL